MDFFPALKVFVLKATMATVSTHQVINLAYVTTLDCFCLYFELGKTMEPSQQGGPDPASQEVNPVYLQQLRELDIPEEAAKQVTPMCLNVIRFLAVLPSLTYAFFANLTRSSAICDSLLILFASGYEINGIASGHRMTAKIVESIMSIKLLLF